MCKRKNLPRKISGRSQLSFRFCWIPTTLSAADENQIHGKKYDFINIKNIKICFCEGSSEEFGNKHS